MLDLLNPKEGQRVVIIQGQWANYAGNVTEVGKDGRLHVWLTGIGKTVQVHSSQCKKCN